MAGWSLSQQIAEHIALTREIDSRGILTQATERDGLAARLAGYAGQESIFINTMHKALLELDAELLASLVDQFNTKAATPANALAFRPFTPVLAAVGN
jgi:hypothetical protein